MLAEKLSEIKEVIVELVQNFIVVMGMESGTRLCEFKSQFLHLLAAHF